ncbi:hypothetical protein RF679_15645 [Undibacterium cyanobacteriorum]|uniref:Uncharacterized protein n=1 Tax=Undibacterium cyanobacteriorum TaxID=3073561 RepID=A0ABY9RIC1_9BURK|nr:hypothetical protein [Undibacterium sp. 20NA77.5]WMW80067.1 hypothetical protein RF679_15645 [Undibacterium sp. 20NA77.5]
MFTIGIFYLLALIVIGIVSIAMLRASGYLVVAAKGAFGSLGFLMAACFIYGLFNRFSFLHGASPPGIESGFAYAMIAGFSVGPIVFIVGGLLTAAISHVRKVRKLKF